MRPKLARYFNETACTLVAIRRYSTRPPLLDFNLRHFAPLVFQRIILSKPCRKVKKEIKPPPVPVRAVIEPNAEEVRERFVVITLLIRQIRAGILITQEMTMRAPVRKMGNSSGVILPKPILTQLGVEAGDDLDLSLDEGRIMLVPAKRHPRAGWADAAKRIAEAGDDALVWPGFGNASDADLKW